MEASSTDPANTPGTSSPTPDGAQEASVVTDPQAEAAPAQTSAEAVPPTPTSDPATDPSSSAAPSSPGDAADNDKLKQLEQLLQAGVIDQETFDAAQKKLDTGEPLQTQEAPSTAWGNLPGQNMPPAPTEEELKAAAVAQSPGEPQVVPEVRPQAFQGGGGPGVVSEASKRITPAAAHGPEQIAAANDPENIKAAEEASRAPNYPVGQRIVILQPHSEAGRMGYVQAVEYTDGVQHLIANSGTPESRFAEVSNYIVRTRDGRSDLLVVPTGELAALEVDQGWGRGQI